jgi:phosphoribosyl 1,2-cyclic phosphate phosphodiesterase
MKLTFLGTGTSQGVPIIGCKCRVCTSLDPKDKRLRSSVWLKDDDISLVIDAGPDFRYQMLRQGVEKLDAIILTHEHRDHIAGLDDVRAFNYIQRKPMDIYAEDRVLEAVKTEFLYAFDKNKYPGVPQINMHKVENHEFFISKLHVIPIRVIHYNLPIFAYRVGEMAYITDASYISPEEKKKLTGLKYLVVNALRKQEHPTHFNLAQALELIKELAPEKAFLTHISHQMGLHEKTEKELPENVHFARDGLSFDFNPNQP